jgi:hypothetical protein
VSATLSLISGIYRHIRTFDLQASESRPKYNVKVVANTNPWIETMKPYMTNIMGFDVHGAKTLALIFTTWAPNIAAAFGNTIRRYFALCDEHMLAPLAASLAHMATYVTRLGQLGTIKASSLQPYMSSVNGVFKDH